MYKIKRWKTNRLILHIMKNVFHLAKLWSHNLSDLKLAISLDSTSLRSYGLQLASLVLNFMTGLEKRWHQSGASKKRVPEESLLFLERTWQHRLGLPSCIWTNHKTSVTMSFGWLRTNGNVRSVESHIHHLSKNTSHQQPDAEAVFHSCFPVAGPWASCGHRVGHELFCLSKCFRVEREAKCLTPDWPKLDCATCDYMIIWTWLRQFTEQNKKPSNFNPNEIITEVVKVCPS